MNLTVYDSMRYLKNLFVILFLLAGLLITQPVYAQTLSHAQQLNVPQGDASLNWSGYVTEQGTYTSVIGSWVVPTVLDGTSSTADATWIGIGGVKTTDLIQAGTQAVVEDGTITYNAWVETLPGFSQTVPLSVQSGDSVTASVSEESPNEWLVTIKDTSTGQSYQTTLTYDSSLSSAEWVEEMVSNGNSTFLPLDSFGSVSFSNGSSVVNGQEEDISQSGAQPLQMINGQGEALATVSTLGGDGASFTVTRTNASASVTAIQGFGHRWHVLQTATSTGVTSIPITITIGRRGRGRFYEFFPSGFVTTFSFSVMWR